VAGSVPDPSVRSQLRADLDSRAGAATIDGDLGVRADAPEGYARMLERSAFELPQLEEGCIELQGAAVRVSGAIRSRVALDALVQRFEASAGDEFRLSFDVEVPDLSETALACQAAYDDMLGAGARVLFDFDSSELHREGRALLDTVEGIWAARCPDVSIIVAGHTDNVGEPAYNRTLSLERARAVVDYLVQQGFDPDKLTAVGYGEAQPRASNDTDDGRTQNRRIEFRIRETER
jgi:OOP family OmpA-OmpF porin